MALSAAVTVGDAIGGNFSNTFVDRVSFAGDGAYATGGSAGFSDYLRTKLGKPFWGRTIIDVISGYIVNGSGIVLHARFDAANDKLLVFLGSTGAEVANASDLSSITFNLTIVSK